MPRKDNVPSAKLQVRRYPWDQWFARKRSFTLYRHTDYNGTDASFMQLVRHKALDIGARVSCMSPGDNLVVVTVTAPPGSRTPQKRVR